MNQELIQDSTKESTTGFATGEICPESGTYRAENKYMATIAIFAKNDKFGPFVDGKKTTWYALTTTTSTNKDGSFESVKVDAGTA